MGSYLKTLSSRSSNNARKLEAYRRVLVVTPVAVERKAVCRGLRDGGWFTVAVSGVGAAAAAAKTAKELAALKYDLVICAGIAGGFPGQAEVGSLVAATEIIAADLGAETADGFRSLADLGFGSVRFPPDLALTNFLIEGLRAAGLPVISGPILTVNTVTGTAQRAAELAERFPGAAAEGMEGYGVALAAHAAGLPVLELRAISNQVGPRDRSVWRIKEALGALEAGCSVLQEVLSIS